MKVMMAAACAAHAALVAGVAFAATAAQAQPAAPLAPPAPATVHSRLDDVQKAGTLRACATGDYKPYSYRRPDGQFEGIDVDLVASLAKSLGVKPVIVPTTWKGLMDDFTAGKCDIAVGGISVTLDRAARAYYSSVVMVDGKSPIVRCADVAKYQTLADLNKPSTRAIANPGGTNERFARQYLPNATLTIYPDNVTIFRQIADGKADVMVTDASETLLQHKLNPSLCPVNPDKPLQFGEKAYLLPRGDDIFKHYVDQWLNLAQKTGEYQAVVDKWLK
ncbi:transporter substrate-binding domain-containing protein [Pandoraea nosoerga]|uniref:ArtI protein n=2 Tax=Pandoraea nosoerga TaxID=2508296 RepID=A0A5E4UKT4_9BURK|nr:transporter substrate-binding domain-containing protein [Pandoraea nosoerga]MBN4674073.1 transporter substrate-binding domain-containing protein [Pandoraea nosoerga]MBN4679993.1 transporter substrate-binding domain-containing protein [Pandoraea nosoerga]MBN4744292.1 transporter substrate-binding domain-containing protein [Pandoraea nosoerga]VVE00502.1 ArtI protein [Pandoraea nosoerga]